MTEFDAKCYPRREPRLHLNHCRFPNYSAELMLECFGVLGPWSGRDVGKKLRRSYRALAQGECLSKPRI